MNTSNKQIIRVIVSFAVLVLFTGCFTLEPKPYDKNNMELYTIAAYSIPYADEMGTTIQIVDKDDYGRVLFQIRFGTQLLYRQTDFSDNYLYAYAICQKSDRNRTYYYEDDCLRVYNTSAEFTEYEQEELKELNDWNKPLSNDKMTARTIISSGKNKLSATVLGLDKALSISLELDKLFLINHNSIDKEYIYEKYLDCNADGKSIGIVWGCSVAENDTREIEAYFIMVDSDCLETGIATIMPINDMFHYWEELKQFKLDNEW